MRGRLLFGPGVSVGRNTWFEGVRRIQVGRGTYIGNHCALRAVHEIRVGENCSLQDGAFLSGDIVIGENTRIANKVSIHSFDHGLRRDRPIHTQPVEGGTVEIGRDVWIGAQVVILKGARIADGAVIGAGSVVTGPIGPCAIAAGVPAREIGTRP